ncbi:hypothetical protein [Euzebya sp.]|uniref:hypothetical protein n=1 Tax=Euzebya sp. TaxID=1971409 RepID=UPI003513C8D3
MSSSFDPSFEPGPSQVTWPTSKATLPLFPPQQLVGVADAVRGELDVDDRFLDGGARDVRLATDDEVDADDTTRALVDQGMDGRWVAFRPADPLPADTPVTIRIGEGTPSAEGPRTTSSDQTVRGRTVDTDLVTLDPLAETSSLSPVRVGPAELRVVALDVDPDDWDAYLRLRMETSVELVQECTHVLVRRSAVTTRRCGLRRTRRRSARAALLDAAEDGRLDELCDRIGLSTAGVLAQARALGDGLPLYEDDAGLYARQQMRAVGMAMELGWLVELDLELMAER